MPNWDMETKSVEHRMSRVPRARQVRQFAFIATIVMDADPMEGAILFWDPPSLGSLFTSLATLLLMPALPAYKYGILSTSGQYHFSFCRNSVDILKMSKSNERSTSTITSSTELTSAEDFRHEKAVTTTQLETDVDTVALHDHQLSQRVTWKCDLRLVPILASLYFTAFLDRTNVANAKLEGFEKKLHIPPNGYNTALWVFYLSFVLSEVPLNLFMNWQKVKPNRWLGGMMFLLGG